MFNDPVLMFNKAHEENQKPHMNLLYRPGKWYCEGCKEYKPKNKRPKVKGWRCNDCN